MTFDFANKVRLQIPEGMVKQIADSAGNVIWKRGYVNLNDKSIDETGAIYNGTGWKYGYRLSGSKGTETVANYHAITGFLPCKAGDTIRFGGPADDYNWTASSGNSVVYYDSNYGYLGSVTAQPVHYGICSASPVINFDGTPDGGICTLEVYPSDKIAYCRISAAAIGYANSVITVNEEIE